ncbi:hypothetical protein MJO29_003236 [Puccinia striiformis f. sp. tritici]|uniref:TBP-associated factor 6 n=1 Tax=Puccinia striiformis f. sp. tritici PST-78 TaxID=1165861 RepID=A0A0L0VHG9_9BASI|nr:hypothetical protein Pst134EB_005995 [Puccinia striiformis f. sp. tritici]KAI7965138.1 hypothetical protein MJO29_003236 [Puccinia striiformis f. sp. tritici]KAI9631311.1 hypothetical protein KEM48_014487 [Puccinia striiformis f. sp. tritici PST-130]KNE98666.1 hypothetical protein PSTG_08036 [Puccinia striiformis f. sp. tritici PST-78]
MYSGPSFCLPSALVTTTTRTRPPPPTDQQNSLSSRNWSLRFAMPVIPIATGVWPKTSVKDVAESLGLGNLSDEAATALSADVEFRLTQLIEDSVKFMRHSKRTNLLVEDVDCALRAKNIEPLWGFASTDTLSFRRTTSAVGNLYFVDEEEIDLTKVLAADLPPVPQETSYTAHWLAVEGIQPAIPQNPTPAELKSHPAFSGLQSSAIPSSSKQAPESQNLTTKEHLSRELRLYFDRVTAAALSNDSSSKTAALASLSGDPGLHQLVPYLIQFAAEKITSNLSHSEPILEHLRDALRILESILSNPHSYLEPYLHQILPSILTCLLSSSFPSASLTDELEREIRCTAGSLLKSQLNRYQHSYPTLRTRILKTLTKSLIDPQSTDRNQLGAIIGVKSLGIEATKTVLSQNIKAFGESLDFSLSEGKLDQSRVDNLIKETLKIMSQAYSDEQIRRIANSKSKKKLRSIPAQDELEAEVGVQFAARLMSTSHEEETKLAYTFIKESTQISDTDDSEDDDQRSENVDEEETMKMDIIVDEKLEPKTRDPIGDLTTNTTDTQVTDTLVADTPVGDTLVTNTLVPDTLVANAQVTDTLVPENTVADTLVADTQVTDTQAIDTQVDAHQEKTEGVVDLSSDAVPTDETTNPEANPTVQAIVTTEETPIVEEPTDDQANIIDTPAEVTTIEKSEKETEKDIDQPKVVEEKTVNPEEEKDVDEDEDMDMVLGSDNPVPENAASDQAS